VRDGNVCVLNGTENVNLTVWRGNRKGNCRIKGILSNGFENH
jgi:hypothetical protein